MKASVAGNLGFAGRAAGSALEGPVSDTAFAISAASIPPPDTPSPIAAPRFGGYLQARQTVQDGPGITFTLNRARITVDGSLPGGFSYRLLFLTQIQLRY